MIFSDYTTLVESGSYLAVFLLMIANGFFSFPSSQLLYIFVGYMTTKSLIPFQTILLCGALGNTVGNMGLFYLTKTRGAKVALEKLPVPKNVLPSLSRVISNRGVWYLYLAKLTPSLKVLAPILAGISKIRNTHAFLLFFSTSYIWGYLFMQLGRLFGVNFSLTDYSLVILVIGVTVISLLAHQVRKELKKAH